MQPGTATTTTTQTTIGKSFLNKNSTATIVTVSNVSPRSAAREKIKLKNASFGKFDQHGPRK